MSLNCANSQWFLFSTEAKGTIIKLYINSRVVHVDVIHLAQILRNIVYVPVFIVQNK